MPHSFRSLRRAIALAAVAGACAGPAYAQSTTITFTNATPPIEIPLLDGSAVSIDGNGNITALCQLSPQSGCVGATSGGAKADVVTLSRTDTNAEVEGGETITLAWTTSGATLCNATSSPAVNGWSGLKGPASGSQVLTMPATAGSYSLGLACYNDSGSTGSKTVAVAVQAPTTPPPDGQENCEGMTGPLVKPSGFTGSTVPWDQAFRYRSWTSSAFSFPEYPAIGSSLAPTGSFTLRSSTGTDQGPPIVGKWIAIPFTAASGVYFFNWLDPQPIPERAYGPSRAASSVYMTLSTCKGDFRLPDNSASDPLLKAVCRKQAGSATITYSASQFGGLSCPLQMGRQYYLNVLFANPSDGLTPTEHTCLDGKTACDVNLRHEKQSN